MAKITKETAAHFQRLAREAKARRLLARKQAQSLAESILETGSHTRETRERLDVQAAALHELIMSELASLPLGHGKGCRLKDWLGAQRMLIEQIARIQNQAGAEGGRGGGYSPRCESVEPLRAMAEEDPEIVTAGIQRALSSSQARPEPPVAPANLL